MRQAFHPRWWGILFNPFFTSRRLLHREIARCAAQMRGGRLLDVGCARMPYRSLFDVDRYWGIEVGGGHGTTAAKYHALYDGSALPFQEGCFDHVLMTEVLEHVFQPDALLDEVIRVMRPGGLLLVTVPFVWDEHEVPHDFGRYASFGLADLLGRHGFEMVSQAKTGNYLSAIGQLLSAYFYNATRGWALPLRALVYASACAAALIGAEAAGRLARAGTGLYLDNVVLARKGPPAA